VQLSCDIGRSKGKDPNEEYTWCRNCCYGPGTYLMIYRYNCRVCMEEELLYSKGQKTGGKQHVERDTGGSWIIKTRQPSAKRMHGSWLRRCRCRGFRNGLFQDQNSVKDVLTAF
jgi:hypothetical protein